LTRSLDELGCVARKADWDCLDDEIGGCRSGRFMIIGAGEIMTVRDGYIGQIDDLRKGWVWENVVNERTYVETETCIRFVSAKLREMDEGS